MAYTYLPETGEFFNSKGREVGSYTRKYGRLFTKEGTLTLSRLAVFLMTGKWPEGEVDHINGDTHDNRWTNLRTCTRGENAKNRRKYSSNKSGYKGVWQPTGSSSYIAKIQVDGKPVYLGSFPSPEEAYAAYCEAAVQYHKEFHSIK